MYHIVRKYAKVFKVSKSQIFQIPEQKKKKKTQA